MTTTREPDTTAEYPTADPAAARTRAFFDRVFPPPRDFQIRLWDGTTLGGETGVRFTLSLRSRGTARRMFGMPIELALGEALIFGDLEIEGDFAAAFALRERARAAAATPRRLLGLLRARRALPRDEVEPAGRAPERARGRLDRPPRDGAAVRFHYDVGSEFYALWLDERMVYSCAYFPTGHEDLAMAQWLKLDHVCRKLRLAPGERLLDIGCGWGALAIHAAREYGARVVGVTLSERQHRLARERAAELGVGDRVAIELRDFRDATGEFDKIASIGMFEHVGRRRDEYFAHVHRLLRAGGLFLNHAIAARPSARAWSRSGLGRRLVERYVLGTGLVRARYVFPDGELLPLSEANLAAEHAGFEVRDVENLREHYVLTLRRWAERLEARRAEAVAIAGDHIVRTWRLYLNAAAIEFERGWLSVNQTLFARPVPGQSSVPLTRADLYG